MMKFGYLFDFRNPVELSKLSDADYYAAMFQQIEYLDTAGYDSIWITEHHFVDDGYLAAAMPMMAAMAARTRRCKIGSYVILAPFYNPLRLAEDAALIDVISNGRLRLGIGLGYRLQEFEIFQLSLAERLGRTLETIQILKRAWTGERFSFSGKYFNFKDAIVRPKPISRPYPELLWGGMAPAAIRRGARLDMGFACNLGAEQVKTYHEALRELGKDPADYAVVNMRLVYVCDDEEQGWRDLEPHLMYQMRLYGEWLKEGKVEAGGYYRADAAALRKGAIIGPPPYVIERLRQIIEATHMTELALAMQLPGLDPRKGMRSLERFTNEVLPALRV
jgi:alkanesulfonate monooxygenase SsuD/methylene tetrahydromethanopterin reductase-like flavin-dependent oxidoreductase (luciferase family)